MPDSSDSTLRRLPLYRSALRAGAEAGSSSMTSTELAAEAGVTHATVRQDFRALGVVGTRGAGYPIAPALSTVEDAIGVGGGRRLRVGLVGVGRLGSAVLRYSGFATAGFDIVAAFDADEGRWGERVGEVEIHPASQLPERGRRLGLDLVIIATPPGPAQEVAYEAASAGVSGVLNLTASAIDAPAGVTVHGVDLSAEITYLAAKSVGKSIQLGDGDG